MWAIHAQNHGKTIHMVSVHLLVTSGEWFRGNIILRFETLSSHRLQSLSTGGEDSDILMLIVRGLGV